MIYCVIPAELEDELYDKLVAHYSGNPDVTVIVDRRREPERRREEPSPEIKERRQVRDRRRARAPGTFLSTDPPE
jgi:hypothetical protein